MGELSGLDGDELEAEAFGPVAELGQHTLVLPGIVGFGSGILVDELPFERPASPQMVVEVGA